MKSLLKTWWDQLASGKTELAHKELLLEQGFLVYIICTYPTMVPYLKGFHLTIEILRGGRNYNVYNVKTVDNDLSVASGKTITSHLFNEEEAGVGHYLSRKVDPPP